MTNWNPNDVAIEIEQMLGGAQTPKKTEWCIYRVPHDLLEVNKDAYTPKVVSIGPFHCYNERLQSMEIHKLVYFKKFLERANANLGELVSFIDNLEPTIRGCYAENIKFDKHKFIKTVLLDACFIIELFLRTHKNDWPAEDALSPGTRISNIIRLDLLLLENQLPFSVLENLFNLVLPSDTSNGLPSFLELTFKYFGYYNKQNLDTDGVNIYHFTDLLRYFHLPKSSMRPKRDDDMEILYFSATELHRAGLRIKELKEPRSPLDFRFSGHRLEIPQIFVEDRTGVVFHNMVAFEQCHYRFDSYITDYVSMFDFLINTSNDVDFLIQNGIIHNFLDDSGAVAKLFNGLGKNVIHANYNEGYAKLYKQLNEFYKNPCQKRIAIFRRDYCNTPWQGAASIAGILLLVLTLIQTICSIFQVMQQSKNA